VNGFAVHWQCIAATLVACGALAVAPGAGAQSPVDLCSAATPGTQCQPGNNRQTPGGGDKASHEGWPAISGVFWKVLDGDHLFVGGPLSDELLGHHGSDVIRGGPGADVIWGDWDPVGNGPDQRDRLSGGSGNDWIYTSHGTNNVRGGSGDDVIWSFYGKGTVDCGPGYDRVRKRYSNKYRFRNCEATLR
jgi:Ca2+-binding RTX toxin-like protein